MPLLIPSAISAGTSIVKGILGSSAAKKAAATQAAAGQAAAAATDKATGQAIDAGREGMSQANSAIDTGLGAATKSISDAGAAQKDIYGNITGGLKPYQETGAYGLDKLKSTAGTFSFDGSNLENDPGYKFQVAQAMKAMQTTAAGRGMLQSGSTLKAGIAQMTGMAATHYGEAYNRALSTFNTNQAGYQSLANMGQSANSQAIQAGGMYGGELTSLANLSTNSQMQGAGMKSNVDMQGNEYIGNVGMQGTEQANQYRTGAANSKAAGTVGAANAWGGALQGVGNAAMSYGMGSMSAGGGGAPAGFTPYSAGTAWAPPPASLPNLSQMQPPGTGGSTIPQLGF